MARQRHGDPPPKRKKAAKKKAGKKVANKVAPKSGKSLLERAAAKKRTKSIAATMEPTRVAKSTDARLDTEVIYPKQGEHPADAIARDRTKRPKAGGRNPLSPIDEERAQFRRGPLSEDTIADICRMLRFTLHRETVERLLGLSKGRIKRWIQRGKASREKIETWHDRHDELVEDGMTSAKAVKKVGPEPDLDLYATLHACVLMAEATGEKTAVASIVDASMGTAGELGDSGEPGTPGIPADWRASAWLLSRKYNKRWGSYAERQMTEEEDAVDGNETQKLSAVDRLANVLAEMVGKDKPTDE